MAVMQHSIIFGGVDSADFDLYIGGEGTFNAPERAVDIVSVPGRNGAIVIDKGHFENIEVRYTVINQEASLATFAQKLSGFRNAICAQRGYQRLSDTFHPDEFRLALFVDEFEVKPIEYASASEFTIKFNCKPQRYLTSGETPVVVADGGSLTNPTLFDAEPLLAIKGSGTVSFGGYEIDVINPYRGDVMVLDPNVYTRTQAGTISESLFNINVSDVANSGDEITIRPITVMYSLDLYQLNYGDEVIKACSATDEDGTLGGTSSVLSVSEKTVKLSTVLDPVEFAFSNTQDFVLVTHTVTLKVGMISNTALVTKYYTVTFDVNYHVGTNNLDVQLSFYGGSDDVNQVMMSSASSKGISVDSTVFILGDPTYLDCELGEAYMIEDGEIVSLNKHIDMGSRLPKLVPGETEFDLSSNITECKVTPRWWKI